MYYLYVRTASIVRVQFGLADSSRILSPLLHQECISSYVRVSEDSPYPKQREIPAAEACDTCNSELTSFWHSVGADIGSATA